MYNRYIPDAAVYAPIEPEVPPEPPKNRRTTPDRSAQKPQNGPSGGPKSGGIPGFSLGGDGLGALLGGKNLFSGKGGLSSLWKTLRLDDLDSGDVLLLLIILLLLVEGDDLDLVIALGLVLIMGLRDDEKEPKESEQ